MEQLDIFGNTKKLSSTDYLPQLDLKALYDFAKEQSRIHWNREFDGVIELVNRKWSRKLGGYRASENKIKLSIHRNKTLAWEDVKRILLHELVHWHLHTIGQPYHDKDIEFARECLRVGAPISGTIVAKKTAEKVDESKS